MYPVNLFVKVIAEGVKVATPPDSTANQVATSVKQAAVFLDGLTAQTPVQQAHALASMLGEGLSAYPCRELVARRALPAVKQPA